MLHYPDLVAGESRQSSLEQAEERLARGRHPEDLSWQPVSVNLRGYLRDCISVASSSSRLLVNLRPPLDLPLESFGTPPLSVTLPVVRLTPQKRNFLKEEGTRVLVFCNPAADLKEHLPEAEAISGNFPGCTFLHRQLRAEEWWELARSHDVIFYLGHGRLVEGLPVISGREGLFSLLPRTLNNRKLIVFGACLEGKGQWQVTNCSFLGPICRIADRKSDFLSDFSRALSRGQPVDRAYLHACQLSMGKGDARHHIFRLHGYFSGSI
ncbi:MAG: hypothetical protein HS115_07440 [Spirochaetales bacterium]|nr:hypothetical protein [Spirochaetales bacterium]